MSRLFKHFCWLLGLALGVSSASAFSLLGPKEGFQSLTLGYYQILGETPVPSANPFGWTIFTAGDFSSSPKNVAEGFRWCIPTLYYTYDENFLNYFGADGVAAVDSAIAMLNSLTNVSSFSSDLSEFPLDELRYNNTAAALHMFDLKSAALELLIERLGLADSTHWTWCMQAKVHDPPSAPCPFYDYQVIQRNYDPISWLPSSWVNGNLYTYSILQVCSPDARGDFTDAEEATVDPNGVLASAVSSPKIVFPRPIFYGAFHTGLTRDDAGGLRYLYRASNLATENAGLGTLYTFTNTASPQVLYPSNLTLLANQSLTNDAPALTALYPGLQILSTTNTLPFIVYNTNITAYLTNAPWDPAGTLPRLVFATNVFPTVAQYFHHTFGNILTIELTNGVWTPVPITDISTHRRPSKITFLTISATNFPAWSPAGSTTLQTNVFTRTIVTNLIAGEFFIIPTNSCGLSFIMPILTNVPPFPGTVFTNILVSPTNITTIVNTNPVNPAASNVTYIQATLDYFTNHVFAVYPVDCVTNALGLRQGIEKITFVRRDFDSLFGRFFYPTNSEYTLYAVTNSQVIPQHMLRSVTQPDIIFTASNLSGSNSFPLIPTVDRTTPTFSNTNAPRAQIGPGTIEGAMIFTFNKGSATNIVNGSYPNFLEEVNGIVDFVWASFDSSSRDPIVYPVGTSISNLLNQVVLTVFPSSLPNGVNNTTYHFDYYYTNSLTAPSGVRVSDRFTGSGGQPLSIGPDGVPLYFWTLTPGSGPLPPDLILSPTGDGSVSGNLSQPGVFNFSIRMTDANGRFMDRSYVITNTP